METNRCDVNHLDADALLPPRKRLLAGLKRQNSDVNSPAPSTSSNAITEFDVHLNNILMSRLSNPNLSNEEIIEASRNAAIEAAKVAEAARANAEEKAAKAAKAVAAAKNALDFVAILSDEAANNEKRLKKNKMKKHVPVQVLYNKSKRNNNSKTDEELARKLHRDINSSPRILKNSSASDTKNHKHKKMKSNGNGIEKKQENEGPVKEIDTIMVDLNTSKLDRGEQVRLSNEEMENGEDRVPSKDKFTEFSDSFGKKRGRIKQKKLPLSICSFRDQTGLKEEMSNQPLFSEGTSGNLVPVEKRSMWKCQTFKGFALTAAPSYSSGPGSCPDGRMCRPSQTPHLTMSSDRIGPPRRALGPKRSPL
ncbi:hypothetical protein BUALT_Bualt06G0105500 [Buddleja alternifolia]|uniref:Uncharacterized protein n=1 Tax=Buddleja alternifolia TaxID=168488 RepID=A0AAV6XM26_9LAMI|nr:hypothetical protein BUALT_Bualt06G0105500 [Buddleja alternifolia]